MQVKWNMAQTNSESWNMEHTAFHSCKMWARKLVCWTEPQKSNHSHSRALGHEDQGFPVDNKPAAVQSHLF